MALEILLLVKLSLPNAGLNKLTIHLSDSLNSLRNVFADSVSDINIYLPDYVLKVFKSVLINDIKKGFFSLVTHKSSYTFNYDLYMFYTIEPYIQNVSYFCCFVIMFFKYVFPYIPCYTLWYCACKKKYFENLSVRANSRIRIC